MSFLSYEQSQASSQPVEVYEFTYQGVTQYFTSADHPVTVGPITYAPLQLARTAFVESGEIGKNNITITAPDNWTISELFAAGPPDDIVTLVIKRLQFQALDVGDVSIVWIGRILTVDWPPLRSELTCESVFTSLRQSGARRVYTTNCPYALYGIECTVDITLFSSTITIDNQSGNILNSAGWDSLGQPNGWWAGGKVIWEYAPGFFAKRGIKNQTGSAAEITYTFPNFPNGTLVTVAPGCDHSFATCIAKFGNGLNFGGWPFMTELNPWGSSSIF